jgi:hypothetical protein
MAVQAKILRNCPEDLVEEALGLDNSQELYFGMAEAKAVDAISWSQYIRWLDVYLKIVEAEGEIFEKNLILGKQRGLIRHLREEEEYMISDIWVGGEGNNGICLEVTAKWIHKVAEAGGLDSTDFHTTANIHG